MKIILNQDIVNLGEEGDIKVVTDGYARNFLFPKKMAVPYNKQNLNMFGQKKLAIEKRKEEKRKEAMGLKERLASEVISVTMPAGEKGKLFGAVTSSTIVEELVKIGLKVEKKRIEIPENSGPEEKPLNSPFITNSPSSTGNGFPFLIQVIFAS